MARKPYPRVDALPLTGEDGEVREMTSSDFAKMRLNDVLARHVSRAGRKAG